eukprot:740689-Prymnesium_polylepis.1
MSPGAIGACGTRRSASYSASRCVRRHARNEMERPESGEPSADEHLPLLCGEGDCSGGGGVGGGGVAAAVDGAPKSHATSPPGAGSGADPAA